MQTISGMQKSEVRGQIKFQNLSSYAGLEVDASRYKFLETPMLHPAMPPPNSAANYFLTICPALSSLREALIAGFTTFRL